MSQTDFDALLALQDLDTHIDQEVHRKVQLPERAELAELQRPDRTSPRWAVRGGGGAW